MLRERTRTPYTPNELRAIYNHEHDRRALGWAHDARITTTVVTGKFLLYDAGTPCPARVADLSCGASHAEVARAFGASTMILSDLAPGVAEFDGPIEETIHLLDGSMVDLFVCVETLEHLVDPDAVLREIRGRARLLVCSLPIWQRVEDEQNGEHLWAFDREGGEAMLTEAGWDPVLYSEVVAGPATGPLGTYSCAVWGCV